MTADEQERCVQQKIAVLINACDVAAKHYDDYYKGFVALDGKAQGIATISGLVLAAIAAFLDKVVFASGGSFRLIATRANGAPAFALYQRDEHGQYALIALHILSIDGDQIAQIDDFLAIDTRLFSRFNLPNPS